MKKLRKLGLFFCMALIPILSACSGGGGSGGGASTPSAVTQGVTFSVAKEALVAAKTTGKSVAAATLDPAARYAVATIADANGNVLLTKHKTDIYAINDSYITSTIPLVPGNYQLTEFFITDVNNVTLYIVPTQSAKAEIKAMVSKVLPISFGVTKDVTSTTALQVLPIGEGTALDYGYPSFIFDVIDPGGVKFMTDVQTLNPPANNWLQIDASLKVNNVDYTVNAVTTTLRVAQAASYTLVYSKQDYKTKTIILNPAEMAAYMTYPLVVVLTPGPNDYHTVTFNSNGGSAVASQSIIDGGTATSPANPTKTGLTFGGWYKNPGLTTSFSFSEGIDADITLYAKWNGSPDPDPIPLGPSKVLKTGQTDCWDEAGTLVTCSGTGQDGELEIGATVPNPRFTDNSIANASDLTQTDNLTKLTWTKYANLPGAAVSWQGALDYVKTLNNDNYLGHNDWRLPNINELKSLVNLQYAQPANFLINKGFINVQVGAYWSSTTYSYSIYTDQANYVSLLDGNVNANNKGGLLYVWPVRGGQSGTLTLAKTGQTGCWDSNGGIACSGTGQDGELQIGVAWPAIRFTDNSVATDTTVTDNLTGLIWMKKATVSGGITWQAAFDYIKNLNSINYLGHSDWRMPNKAELESLVHMQQASQSGWLTQVFSGGLAEYYWTSTSEVNETARAWFFRTSDGIALSTGGYKGATNVYVWPVCGPQQNP